MRLLRQQVALMIRKYRRDHPSFRRAPTNAAEYTGGGGNPRSCKETWRDLALTDGAQADRAFALQARSPRARARRQQRVLLRWHFASLHAESRYYRIRSAHFLPEILRQRKRGHSGH